MTSKTMVDPVTTIHGYTVERKALARWFAQGYNTCPISGEPLKMTSDHIFSNKKLRKEIQIYLFEQHEHQEEEQQGRLPQHKKQEEEEFDDDYEQQGSKLHSDLSLDSHLRDHPFFAYLYDSSSNVLPNGIPKTIYITPDSDIGSQQGSGSSFKVTKKIGKTLKRIFSMATISKNPNHKIVANAA